jgi:hypothetical protein
LTISIEGTIRLLTKRILIHATGFRETRALNSPSFPFLVGNCIAGEVEFSKERKGKERRGDGEERKLRALREP